MTTNTRTIAHGLVGKIQRALAMSEVGARGFIKAVGWSVLHYLSMMLPAVLVYLFVRTFFDPSTSSSGDLVWRFILLAIVFIMIMYYVASKWYTSTYITVYDESARMRLSLAEHLRHLPLAFFDRRNASDLTSIIMGDATFLEHAYSHNIPQLCGAAVMVVLMMIGLISLQWQLGLALMWVVPVVLVLFVISLRMQKRLFRMGHKRQLAVNEKIDEGIRLVQVIKSYGQEDRYLKELDTTLCSMEESQVHFEAILGIIINLLQGIIRLGFPTLLIVGSTLYLGGEVSLELLLFFILLSGIIYEPLYEVLVQSSIVTFATVRVDRMNDILDHEAQTGEKTIELKGYDITFDHVSFSYEDGKKVLEEVSFTARQGQTTALVGPSGGGKSTCARLAARFWDADSGTIYLGGIDVSTVDPETLLKEYAIVFQDVVLFNTSVLENIRIGKRNASDEEVHRAARLAQCDEFVKQLPQGYETLIGENGSHLSGGERQRISIARAILKNAPIVIMDEATASQDVENETKIQQALSTLIKDKTVLIIAHRMRTIADADQVVVLENGRVVECGSPADLEATQGKYHHMLHS